MPTHSMRFNTEPSRRKIERILLLLSQQPMSSNQLAAAVPMSHTALMRYVQHLIVSNPKRIFVLRYDAISRKSAPVYAKGNQPNAHRTPKSNAQKWAEIKADPVRLARTRERLRNNSAKRRDASSPKRPRRIYEPPLCDQIVSLLERSPGYTTSKIADKLDAPFNTVEKAVAKLSKAQRIQRAAHSDTRAYEWELPHKPMPAPLAKTLGIKPQSWAAALGV